MLGIFHSILCSNGDYDFYINFTVSHTFATRQKDLAIKSSVFQVQLQFYRRPQYTVAILLVNSSACDAESARDQSGERRERMLSNESTPGKRTVANCGRRRE